MNQKQPLVTEAIVTTLALVLVVSGGLSLINKKSTTDSLVIEEESDSSAAITALPTLSTPTSIPSLTSSSAYKDGTYTATGSYNSPGGTEELAVTLTLANGIVTASSITEMAEGRTSREFQSTFATNYKSKVVGKNIDEITLGKISGSSLTPKGFNAAVATIKARAKS